MKFLGHFRTFLGTSRKFIGISKTFLGISMKLIGISKKKFLGISKRFLGISRNFRKFLKKKILWKIPYKKSYLVYPALQISRNSENPCAEISTAPRTQGAAAETEVAQ